MRLAELGVGVKSAVLAGRLYIRRHLQLGTPASGDPALNLHQELDTRLREYDDFLFN
jgi:hypothetical protein